MKRIIFLILFLGIMFVNLYSQTWTYYTNPNWAFDDDPYGRTHIIAADVYGNLWLAPDYNKGLWKFDIEQNKFISYAGIISGGIYSIFVENEKYIWIGTATNGIYLFDGTNIIEHYYDGPPDYKYTMPNNIFDLLVDGTGHVVFTVHKSGWEEVIVDFDRNFTFTLHSTTPGPVFRELAIESNSKNILLNDESGNLIKITAGNYEDWASTAPGGTYIYDYAIDFKNNRWVGITDNANYLSIWLVKVTPDDTETTYNTSVCSNTVQRLIVDNDGRIVCGLAEKGVAIYDGTSWEYYNKSNGLASSNVYAVAQTKDGDYWFFHDYPGGIISRLHIPGREGFQILTFTSNTGYSNSTTGYLTITGTGFKDGAKVKLVRDGENDIWAIETVVVDNHTMKCRFSLTNAKTGKWGVMAYNHYRWPQFNYKMYKAEVYEVLSAPVAPASDTGTNDTGTEEYNVKIPNEPARVYGNIMNPDDGESAKIVMGKSVRAAVKIYTIRGSLIKEYEEKDYTAGGYVEWDGTYMNTGRKVGSGVYIVVIKGDGIDEKKRIIIRR